jgi:hypothetical protein
MSFNGIGVGMHNVSRLSHARTRSISAENPTGEKGRGGMSTDGPAARAARDLGQGWKVSPYTHIPAGETLTLAEIEGPGEIQHIWLTIDSVWWRRLVIRVYWDGAESPSIEVPLGDFFCNGWGEPALVNSLPISVNPLCGFNSYWPMPFRGSARITVENLYEEDSSSLYYQVDYALSDVPDDAAYLHAQWRRSNPLEFGTVHTILDGVRGQGHYVGTYLAWQSNNTGWWGEGEVKFFMDGDEEFPTICGTGTEDYFGGAWDFEYPRGQYREFTTPYLGLPQVISAGEGGLYRSQQRFGMYRWHIQDTVRFEEDLRVTVQALGWGAGGRYLPLQDDIASTAFWYQDAPHAPLPPLTKWQELLVV